MPTLSCDETCFEYFSLREREFHSQNLDLFLGDIHQTLRGKLTTDNASRQQVQGRAVLPVEISNAKNFRVDTMLETCLC